jgi:catechol 2,3-dioxygenase-like lactoylglutathione lyase family enzyme
VDLELVTLIVEHYGRAIDFFVGALGFELVEDSPSVTNDGRPKLWVVVRPPGARTGLLLAQADGDAQAAAVGQQFAGRVGHQRQPLGSARARGSPGVGPHRRTGSGCGAAQRMRMPSWQAPTLALA